MLIYCHVWNYNTRSLLHTTSLPSRNIDKSIFYYVNVVHIPLLQLFHILIELYYIILYSCISALSLQNPPVTQAILLSVIPATHPNSRTTARASSATPPPHRERSSMAATDSSRTGPPSQRWFPRLPPISFIHSFFSLFTGIPPACQEGPGTQPHRRSTPRPVRPPRCNTHTYNKILL